MQFVILIDSDKNDMEDMADTIKSRKYLIVNTEHCSEFKEYRYLLNTIRAFSKSNKEILLAKFSGKESVAKDLGDECSEMVLTLSNKENSSYYTECPQKMFTDLVSIFDKGD